MSREIKFRAWDGDESRSYRSGPYRYVKADWHPNANGRGYVLLHRLVLESKLGQYLPKHAVVHHINQDKSDNRPENLEYHPDQKFHAKSHDAGKRNLNGTFVAVDPAFNEIKFRLLNTQTGLYEFRTLANLIKTTFRNSQFRFAGRWTGLRDSKGIEIYEGDIVEVTERKTGTLRNGERGLVEWRGCEFVCRSLPPDDWDPMAPCFNPMLAPLLVIGNVHEHPHLLGNESKQP